MKTFRVWWKGRRRHEWHHKDVDLPLPEEEPMRPRIARMAAMAVYGADHGVWVESNDNYMYALYPDTERKLVRGVDYGRE